MPQWVVEDYSLLGYPHSHHAVVAAAEYEQAELRPELVLDVRDPDTDQTQTIRLQYGLDGFTQSSDTWIGATDPQTNHVSDATLILGGGGQANLLLGFQPAGIPESAEIVSARLVLHVLQWADGASDVSLPGGSLSVASLLVAGLGDMAIATGRPGMDHPRRQWLSGRTRPRPRTPLGVATITAPGCGRNRPRAGGDPGLGGCTH